MSTDSVIREDELFSDADETVDETVLDDSADVTSEAETEQGQEQSPAFDWEADLNPYKQRFSGLQGRLQQEVERARALEAQLQAVEANAFRQSIADLDEDEQRRRWNQYQNEQNATRLQHELAHKEQRINEAARVIVVKELAQQYGVPAAELNQFHDPLSMEQYARAVSEARRTARRQQRVAKKADAFESGRPVSQPTPKREYKGDLDAAAFDFSKLPTPTRR